MFNFKKSLTVVRKFVLRKIKLMRRAFLKLPRISRLCISIGSGAALVAVIVLIIVLPKQGSDTAADASVNSAALIMPDSLGQAAALSDDVEVFDVATPAPTLLQVIQATSTPVPTPTPTPDPTLKRGCDSEEVRELQTRLMELGYLDIDETTTYFGPATERAVELFQRQVSFIDGSDFAQDGIAGPLTLELIYSSSAPKYVVKEGMSGDDITNMQYQLVDLGYMKKTTGYYGTETISAMKEFQDRNGLSADGLAGEKTVELLYSPNAKESASKAQEARRKANISTMIDVAKSKIGCSYVRGARGPKTFDCSGLVYYCLNQAGSNRNRLNAAGYSQVSDWEKITSMGDLQRGDLIFFYDNAFSKVGHVGICMGGGEMIDASSANGKVVRRSYTTTYWKKHFVCGRRPW